MATPNVKIPPRPRRSTEQARQGRTIRTDPKITRRYAEELNNIVNRAASNVAEGLGEISASDEHYDEKVDALFQEVFTSNQPSMTAAVQTMSNESSTEHREHFSSDLKQLYGVNVTGLINERGLAEALDDLIDENLNMVQTEFFEGTREKMQRIISRALVNGQPSDKSLLEMLLEELPDNEISLDPITKQPLFKLGNEERIKFIARDQTQRVTGALTRIRQQGAGINKYKWVTSHDNRVRDSHELLNGMTVEWATGIITAAPPRTKKWVGRTTTDVIKSVGRSPASDGIHPQQGFNCRCIAAPILEL